MRLDGDRGNDYLAVDARQLWRVAIWLPLLDGVSTMAVCYPSRGLAEKDLTAGMGGIHLFVYRQPIRDLVVSLDKLPASVIKYHLRIQNSC